MQFYAIMKLFNAITMLSFNMAAASNLSRARHQLRALQEEDVLDTDSSMSLASDSIGSGAMSKSSKVFGGKSSKTAVCHVLFLALKEGLHFASHDTSSTSKVQV